jgi:hypothetical protein
MTECYSPQCIQKYWGFGLFPSSGILGTRKHDVSETASVSVLRCDGGKTPTQLGPSDRANLNHWTPHLKTETDPASETSCFLVPRISDDGKKSKNPVFLNVIHHRQNPLESTKLNIYFINDSVKK